MLWKTTPLWSYYYVVFVACLRSLSFHSVSISQCKQLPVQPPLSFFDAPSKPYQNLLASVQHPILPTCCIAYNGLVSLSRFDSLCRRSLSPPQDVLRSPLPLHSTTTVPPLNRYTPPPIIGKVPFSNDGDNTLSGVQLIPIRLSVQEDLRALLNLKASKKHSRVFFPVDTQQLTKTLDTLNQLSIENLKTVAYKGIPSLERLNLPIGLTCETSNGTEKHYTVLNTDKDVNACFRPFLLEVISVLQGKGISTSEALMPISNPLWDCKNVSSSSHRVTSIERYSLSASAQPYFPVIRLDLIVPSIRLIAALDPAYWSNATNRFMNTIKAHKHTLPTDSYSIISFFKFTSISNPEGLARKAGYIWKYLGILGRVYVAQEGVNGQVAVPSDSFALFKRSLPIIFDFGDTLELNNDTSISFHAYWNGTFQLAQASVPTGNSKTELGANRGKPYLPPFKHLHVRYRPQIVSDGFASASLNLSNFGSFVPSEEWHKLCEKNNHVMVDCRNKYESLIGSFPNSIALNTSTFKNAFGEGGALDKVLSDIPREKPILMYCTGGIRCVKAGAYAIQKLGFKNVLSLKGGIIAYKNYIEQHNKLLKRSVKPAVNSSQTIDPSDGVTLTPILSKYKGSNYVFDNRFSERVTEDILSVCATCTNACDRYANCNNQWCHKRFLQCHECGTLYSGCCSIDCFLAYTKTRNVTVVPCVTVKKSSAVSLSPEKQQMFIGSGEGVLSSSQMEAQALRMTTSSNSNSKLLQQLRVTTKYEFPTAFQMASSELQGRVLSMLSKMVKPQYVLDIGTFTGISALSLAEGLQMVPTSKLYTVEMDTKAAAIAQSYIDQSSYRSKIKIIQQPALQYLRNLHSETLNSSSELKQFDLIFLDADKRQYPEYYNLLFNQDRILLSENGILLVDNTLWVNEPKKRLLSSTSLSSTKRMLSIKSAIEEFNTLIYLDTRLEQVILPFRDGLSIIKLKNSKRRLL